MPGVEVLAVELLSPSRFCVYVDHPEGVDHALCARGHAPARRLPRGLHDRRVLAGPERPLRKPQHFALAVGRHVAVRTEGKIAGRNRFKGELVEAGDGAVMLATAGTPIRYESRTTPSCGRI